MRGIKLVLCAVLAVVACLVVSSFQSGKSFASDDLSDQRIKKISGKSDPARDLALINNLTVQQFRFIDTRANSSHSRKGFVAQDVEAVYPDAVSSLPDFIPSIYSNGILTFNEEAGTLNISVPLEHGLQQKDEVRLLTVSGKKDAVVTAIVSPKEFVVPWKRSDFGGAQNVFVYGKKVPDYRTLDYYSVFSAGIGAVQELSRRQEIMGANAKLLQEKMDPILQMFSDVTSANPEIRLIIAEIEALYPDIINRDQKGDKIIDYPKLTVVLWGAVKEQQKQIDALRDDMESLKRAR